MESNMVSATITGDQQADIKDGFDGIIAILPGLPNLTAEERQSMSKMSVDNEGFCTNCLVYMGTNPELVPSDVDVAGANRDFELSQSVKIILAQIVPLLEGLQNLKYMADHETYIACLAFYGSVKAAAKRDVYGAKVIYAALKPHFAKNKKKVVVVTPTPPPAP